MLRHFVPSRWLHPLAPLMQLSTVDLPSANSMKCCSPPASLKKQNTENQTVDWSHYAKSRRSFLCALKDFSTARLRSLFRAYNTGYRSMRSMNACMNSFCSASAAEPYIYILPNANSGFLKIPVDFSVQSVIIGIYRKKRGSVHAKTAAVPSDLWRTTSR